MENRIVAILTIITSVGVLIGGPVAALNYMDERYAPREEVVALSKYVLRGQIWELMDRIEKTPPGQHKDTLRERLRQIKAEYCDQHPEDVEICGRDV